MSSINLAHNYEEHLMSAKPTFFGSKNVPFGALGEESIDSPQTIPPLNTNINYSMLPTVEVTHQKGLADMSVGLPITFNWRNGTKNEKTGKFNNKVLKNNVNILALISTPGNQMLCGSCWAIATAGIISDNFVVSGQVDWKPDLSTSYSLMCYPQNQCKGGNPATLMNDISNGGIVSKHCLDYSWCSENPKCNGSALKHFKQSNPDGNIPHTDLNSFLPMNKCGCYNDGKFLEYKIQKIRRSSLKLGKIDLFRRSIKSNLIHQGPVLGSFLVFENFMKGAFSKGKTNKGIYFENATYNDDIVTPKILDINTYKGSHAIAIIGYGIENDVTIPGGKTGKVQVPYWYCRNSWGTKWGDGGYFKMAMYPFNKLSQFGKIVEIKSLDGRTVQGGGIVLLSTNSHPKLVLKKKIIDNLLNGKKRKEKESYYVKDTKDRPKFKEAPVPELKDNPSCSKPGLSLFKKIVLILFVLLVFITAFMTGKGWNNSVTMMLGIIITILLVIGITLLSRHLIMSYCKSNCKSKCSKK